MSKIRIHTSIIARSNRQIYCLLADILFIGRWITRRCYYSDRIRPNPIYPHRVSSN